MCEEDPECERILDCGGKQSATPLLDVASQMKRASFQSGVAATLCHRNPK